jgi:lipoyl(octanoyl) transferase
VIVRRLGRVDYAPTFAAMQEFTAARDADTPDELWLCEHPPVFTQGLSGKPEHLLRDIGIPVVLDLRRRELTVRGLVNRIEQAVIDLLAGYGVAAARLEGAPGVYVGRAKIAALGLRIKHGCSYHGVSLNVDMDLSPYDAINPCGYEGMAVTQIRDLVVGEWDTAKVGEAFAAELEKHLQ